MADSKNVRRSARRMRGTAALGSTFGDEVYQRHVAINSLSTSAPVRGTYFRLLDLPAEIRNLIYGFAFATNKENRIHHLADLKFPLLIQVNHQVRYESFALFFSENAFYLNVGTNIRDRLTVPRLKKGEVRHSLAASSAGTLSYKPIVKRFLNAAGVAAIFKDFTFRIHDSMDVQQVRDAERRRAGARGNGHEEYATLRVTTTPMLAFDVDTNAAKDLRTVQAAEEAAGDAIAIAREIGGRDGFKGFRVEDLHKIARAFCY